MNAFWQGMEIGAGLIVAIGAQNAFVLTQGILKQHHLTVALICSMSDMILIFCGVSGFGEIVAMVPLVKKCAIWAGIIMLVWLGARSFIRIFKRSTLSRIEASQTGRRQIILTTLALTFLNPHVYVDTIILLGSLGAQLEKGERLSFALGATSASFLWFFSLSIGGVILAPLFAKNISWKLIDMAITITMWSIAWQFFAKF